MFFTRAIFLPEMDVLKDSNECVRGYVWYVLIFADEQVKVLGTFITEWEEGTIICNTLLESKESAQMYAERLAELAVALGFDGWLVYLYESAWIFSFLHFQ